VRLLDWYRRSRRRAVLNSFVHLVLPAFSMLPTWLDGENLRMCVWNRFSEQASVSHRTRLKGPSFAQIPGANLLVFMAVIALYYMNHLVLSDEDIWLSSGFTIFWPATAPNLIFE
jgi:hypothetical protein